MCWASGGRDEGKRRSIPNFESHSSVLPSSKRKPLSIDFVGSHWIWSKAPEELNEEKWQFYLKDESAKQHVFYLETLRETLQCNTHHHGASEQASYSTLPSSWMTEYMSSQQSPF